MAFRIVRLAFTESKELMHIERISIQGFRNFKGIELDGLPSTLIFVGENGSGKSNLLYALRLVLDPSLPDTARQLSAEDFWDGFDNPFGGNLITVSVDISGFDDDIAAKAVLTDCLVGKSPLRARLNYVYRPRIDSDDVTNSSGYDWIRFGGDREDQFVRREVLRYISIRVLPALRDAESDLNSNRSPLRQMLSKINIDPAHLTKVGEAIDEASAALLADEGVAALNEGISTRLLAMVGELFAVSTTLGIASNDLDQLTRTIRLFVSEAKQRGVGQISLGTANLLYLTLLLEQISAQESSGESVITILAAEEPEAHLHPHLQRVVFRHLLAAERPIIVTTHSPHLVSVAPLHAITLLRNVGGETKPFHAREASLDAQETKDIERYLDVTRAELLFAKAVILVEGVAEQYLVPAFANSMGFDVDAHGVTVCSVHGTNFRPFHQLLGTAGLNIPHVIVTDGDPRSPDSLTGTNRARQLLPELKQKNFDEAISQVDEVAIREALSSNNLFVGYTTLELDLIHSCLAAMEAAYSDLEQSQTKRSNFREDMTAFNSGDDTRATAILNRIAIVGKGRFAQRLADHIDGLEAPLYISNAIERIRSIVNDDE